MIASVEYLTSAQGMELVNGAACAIFVVFILVAVLKQTISLGSAMPPIKRSEKPRVYWSVMFVFAAIAAWTGGIAAFRS